MDAMMQNATPEQQQEIMARVEDMHVRDMRDMFNGLTKRCFQLCVSSFRGLELAKDEEQCVTNCVEKYIKSTSRIGTRFAEFQQAQNAAMQQQQQAEQQRAAGFGRAPGGARQ